MSEPRIERLVAGGSVTAPTSGGNLGLLLWLLIFFTVMGGFVFLAWGAP